MLKISRKHGEHWSFGTLVYQSGEKSGGRGGWLPTSYCRTRSASAKEL
jgi:hypothetical protein